MTRLSSQFTTTFPETKMVCKYLAWFPVQEGGGVRLILTSLISAGNQASKCPLVCVCVCAGLIPMCVCVRAGLIPMCVCVRAGLIPMCVCVCWPHSHVCVCVCWPHSHVCVCVLASFQLKGACARIYVEIRDIPAN